MMIFFLFAISLLCVATGLYAIAKKRAETRRAMVDLERLSRRNIMFSFCLLIVLSSACFTASAQEIIHARAGQVVAINPKYKTISLQLVDGQTIVFSDVASPEPALAFNKDVRSKTVAAAAFDKIGAHVVVFYYGYGNLTAVAVKEIGTSSTVPNRSIGSVADFDRHQHLLTLKTDAGEPQKLLLSDDTIVDTPEGIVRVADFHPSKGAQLRCFAGPEAKTALFVAPN